MTKSLRIESPCYVFAYSIFLKIEATFWLAIFSPIDRWLFFRRQIVIFKFRPHFWAPGCRFEFLKITTIILIVYAFDWHLICSLRTKIEFFVAAKKRWVSLMVSRVEWSYVFFIITRTPIKWEKRFFSIPSSWIFCTILSHFCETMEFENKKWGKLF